MSLKVRTIWSAISIARNSIVTMHSIFKKSYHSDLDKKTKGAERFLNTRKALAQGRLK
jgi:hypothetical protein